jgi:DNA polymerase-3 subunit delta
MSLEDLKKSMTGGVAAPLYFFCGDNAPLIDEALRLLSSALFPEGAAELDVRQLDALSHGPGEILEAARTQSFFSKKKLVIVRQAQTFKEEQWDKLKDYFKKPSASCCIVFILPLDEKDKKDKARIEAFRKIGPVFSFQNPRGDRQIMGVVKEQLAGRGKSIAQDALAYCGALLGENAQAIAGEIEKLALYCGERKTVTVADVEAVVCGGDRGTIFNLVDAVGEGKLERSLELLGGILGAGVHPLVILKMLARQFRLIQTARLLLDQGEPSARIAQKLRLPEFVVRGLLQQARGWPAGRMSMVFEEIFQANSLSKSSRSEPGIVLERLLLRLPELRA